MFALGLAVAPLLSAGAQKEIRSVTSTEMVDRMVPDTVTYVQLPGLAMPVVLPAPAATGAPPYGLLVRDAVDSDAFTIVTTGTSPIQLESRDVVGRVSHEDMSAAVEALGGRGESTVELDASLLVLEVVPSGDEPIRDISSTAELADLADDTLVRLGVTFAAEAVASCTIAPDGCAGRTLAAGHSHFVHLAHGPGGAPILIQTTYPASVVPGTWTGTQVRNQSDLEEWVSQPAVQLLAGWGRVLVLISIIDDPTVVRNQQWLGPILFALIAVLLWLGLRIGYPVFRPSVEGSRRWLEREQAEAEAPSLLAPTPVRVSGHAKTVGDRYVYLDETLASLNPIGTSGLAVGRATAALRLDDGEEIALAAVDIGSLGRAERGDMVTLRGVRPALWVRWFGTNLRITFDSAAERDAAARVIGQ